MWKAILAALLILLATKAMRGQSAPATGSIGGQVINAATGLPVAGAGVTIHIGATDATVKADAAGRYVARDLAPGSGTVYTGDAELDADTERAVILHAGENLTFFDLQIRPPARISGKVVDADGKPVPNMFVDAVAREYREGALHYFYANNGHTDASGKFHIEQLDPGRGYLVMVDKGRLVRPFDPSTDSPKDPRKRRPVIVTTFYPGVPSTEEAEPIVLKPGETRDDIDVTVLHSTSFCADGKVVADRDTEPLGLRVSGAEPNNGIVGEGDVVVAVLPGLEPTQSDGTFRVCGLPQGNWRFAVTQGAGLDPTLYGSEPVSVVDADIHDLTITPLPRIALPGEVVWDGAESDPPAGSQIVVKLQAVPSRDSALDRRASAALPGSFSIDGLLAGDYAVSISGIPDGMYVKDVTYGANSVLYKPLQAGSEPAGTGLRVTIARDGGFIQAKSAAGSWITIIPVTAKTEAAVSAMQIGGNTDQSGTWKSAALAPGKYYVLATARKLYMTPETLVGIMVERLRTDPVDVGPNATVTVTAIATNVE